MSDQYVPNRHGKMIRLPDRIINRMRERTMVQQPATAPTKPVDPNTIKWAQLSTDAPRIPWDVFVRDRFKWLQGEHVGMIGPTGQGKTTLLLNILPLKPYVVVFATKPRDETMNTLIGSGYLKMERWQSIDPRQFPRRVLWPDARRMASQKTQQEIFHDAFARIYVEGGWTVALDELWYMTKILKLAGDIKQFLLQGRSLGISLIAATQRPAEVPLEVYDQSTHLFFWRDNDERNLMRLSGISYKSARLVRQIVSDLEKFQVLYINTRTGEMLRTRSPEVRFT